MYQKEHELKRGGKWKQIHKNQKKWDIRSTENAEMISNKKYLTWIHPLSDLMNKQTIEEMKLHVAKIPV